MSQTQLLPKWTVVKLKNLCQKTAQTTPNKQPDKPFIYVDVSSVSNEFYRIVEAKTLMGKDAPSRARKLIQTDDVIFATVRPTLRRVAIVPSELEGQVCSTGFCVLRANKKELVPDYLYFYLLTRQVAGRVELLQKGATYPAINDSDLFEQFVQLPPLSEQRAIARALISVQEGKEARQKEAAFEQERKAALMQYLFTHGTRNEPLKQAEIGKIPWNWRVVRLGELSKIQSGGTPSRKRPEFYGGQINWVKTLDLNDGIVRDTEETITELGFESIRGRMRPLNTVMVAMYGGAGTVGKSGILGVPAATNQAVCCIEPNPEKFDSFYLLYFLIYIRPIWMRYAIGTRKDPNISKGIIEGMQIPLPPLDQQREIAGILRACDAKIVALGREAAFLDELFHAMLEELMTGRLSAIPLIDREEHQ